MEEGTKMQVLHLDDEELMQRVVQRVIQRSLGDYVEVVSVKDGIAGLGVLASNPNPFSLIITDNNMGSYNKGGLEFISNVRSFYDDETPIIMQSSPNKEWSAERLHQEVKKRGGLGLMLKPDGINYLNAVVEDILERRVAHPRLHQYFVTAGLEPKTKVLAIDDCEDIQEMYKNVLSGFGNLSIARDGVEGLEYFQRGRPDVIVTDINLPRKHGFWFASQVRKATNAPPLIAVSGRTVDNAYISGLKRAGFLGAIQKPTDSLNIADTVAAVIQGNEEGLKQVLDVYVPENSVGYITSS